MKAIEIRNRKVSVYSDVKTFLGNTTIGWILNEGSTYVKDKVEFLRNNYEYHTDEYKQFKQQNMSAWVSGGVINNTLHRDIDIVEHSNIVCIDIDSADNPNVDLNELKKTLFNYKWCYAVSSSVSGKGIYIIVPIKDYVLTKDYYDCIAKFLQQNFNVNVDGQCTNIARLRYMSYDSDILIKDDNEDIIEWNQIINKANYTNKTLQCEKPNIIHIDDAINTERTFNAMSYIINNGYKADNLGHWYHLGCELKNHPDGYQLFCILSRNNPKYNDSQSVIDKKWNECEATGINNDLHRKWQGMYKNQKH